MNPGASALLALSLLFPVGVAWFGTVHPGARLTVLALVAATATAVMVLRRRPSRGHRALLGCLVLALAAWVTSLLALVPAGPSLRGVLQPGIAPLLDASLALVGSSHHPLAVSPHRALTGLGFAGGMIVLAAATASVVHHRGHLRLLARVLVGTGLVLAILGALQVLTHAESVYWITGIPGYSRSPFFGSFVNPNHAAYALVVVAPLAAGGLAMERRGWERALGATTLVIIVLALAHIGCRGAVAVAALEVMVIAALAGSRWFKLAVAVGVMTVAVVALAVGPAEFLQWASSLVNREEQHRELLTRRFDQWRDSLALLRGNPWVGVGSGGYDDAHTLVKTAPLFLRSTHLHQEPLQALLEHGVLSGALWIAALTAPLVLGLRRAIRMTRGPERRWTAAYCTAGVGILGASLFDFPLRIGAFAVLASLVLGALAGTRGAPDRAGWAPSRLLRAGTVGLAVAGIALFVVARTARESVGSPWADATTLSALAESPEPPSASRAVELMEGAVRAEPLDYYAVIGLGGAFGRAGRLEEAAAAFEVGTRIAPTLPWAWLHLARLRDRGGDWEAAQDAWARMLWCNLPEGHDPTPYVREALSTGPDPLLAAERAIPDRPVRMGEAARILAKNSSDPEYQTTAEALYQRAASGGPKHAAAYANFLLKRDRPEEAWEVVSLAESDRCESLRVGAATLRAMDRLEEAEARYQKAQERCGERKMADVEAGLVAVQLDLGRPLAMAQAEETLVGEPNRHQLRRKLIEAYLRQPRSAETRERLEVHLGALDAAGVATAREVVRLERVRRHLPILDVTPLPR